MKKLSLRMFVIVSLAILCTASGYAQTINFSTAKIVCYDLNDKVVAKSVSVLQEEVFKRTQIQLPAVTKWPVKNEGVIILSLEKNLAKIPAKYIDTISKMNAIGSEGYKILVLESLKTILIVGYDARGVLYGVGKLLRKMEMHKGQAFVPAGFSIASSPTYPIRGHQLGYRPKTNSYDAWLPKQFDSYIRDLVIFGANSIEIMPPRTDDRPTSVNMKMPAIEMIAEQSKICDSYGMDVWMWYPNLGKDYVTAAELEKEIKERHEIFKAVPRLDAVFVPGGDPGDLEPDVLFTWLAKEAEILHQYHPNAKMWVSPQCYRPTQKWYDRFYTLANKNYPWLGGIVFGPWIKTSLQEMRKIINPNIPIRNYPDITHSIECQYPVPKWDLAYAITLSRECINPRPNDQKIIHNGIEKYTQGSISYSEGTNDDVNKIVWSDQDWNPQTPVMETMRDYARYFVGSDYTESVSQGMMALEKNLQGPLLENDGVERTLQQWQDIEHRASEEVMQNPRFQMGLIRAYFDAYTYRRLIYETGLELEARGVLSKAAEMGSLTAIKKARETLLQAKENKVMPTWRQRCFALADSLFKSLGAQLTVEKHHAQSGRGNFIDHIDLPLNDMMWLTARFDEIEKLTEEDKRLQGIYQVLHRTDPGPGGFYDNFGSPKSWERVQSSVSWKDDPGGLQSPRAGYGIGLYEKGWMNHINARDFESKFPLAWMMQVATLHDQPLKIVYDNLDPKASYSIKVAYTGAFKSTLKLLADDIMVHDFMKTGVQPVYEFPIPSAALADGVVQFQWTCAEGEIGSQVSEIWIIKK